MCAAVRLRTGHRQTVHRDKECPRKGRLREIPAAFQGSIAGEKFRLSKRQAARKQFVDLEAEAVVGKRGVTVGRDHELLIVNQVGRVPQHVPAFLQRIQNQPQVQLFQIADPAVHQFRASA